MYGIIEKFVHNFVWENLKESGHLRDIGIDGNIILNWIIEKWWGGGVEEVY
jgi:hypothetical protein